MFGFGKKKRANTSEETVEFFELIQESVHCILESRAELGLDTNAVHQIAYFVMYTRLLLKVGMITPRQKILIRSAYVLHCEKDIKEDCSATISHFDSIFDSCLSNASFVTAIQRYAFSVEMEINAQSSDHCLRNSVDCVVDNVQFFLHALKQNEI